VPLTKIGKHLIKLGENWGTNLEIHKLNFEVTRDWRSIIRKLSENTRIEEIMNTELVK
jgi:hypothetical protein